MAKKQFYVAGKPVELQVIYTNNQNAYLKIVKNQIVLSCPGLMNENLINLFLERSLPKLLERQIKLQMPFSFENSYFYLGNNRHVFYIMPGFDSNTVVGQHGNYCLKTKAANFECVSEAITEFWEQELSTYLNKRVYELSELMQIKTDFQVKINRNTTTGAINFLKKGLISFNLKLACVSKASLDYVIVHELAHYFYPNHQAKFGKVVQTYCPDYRLQSKVLKHFSL